MPNMDLYAALIAGLVGGSGGGGGGTSNYNSLSNKPQINGNTLAGNKTAAQLGLQTPITFDDEPTSGSSHAVRSGGVYSAIAQKVDKVPNKGLSSNDYTDSEKTKLAGIPQNAEANVITGITLNGETLVPVNKIIAINVITKAVNDLTNYYLKSETYTKTEVDALINSISSLTLDIVEELPVSDISTTTIYLVPVAGASNVYMQYAYINNDWAQLGTTQVDLTNYYTKSQIDAFLLTKQDVLTFDNEPTASSDNPVKSGGIYAALAGKQDTLTFDSIPTENSTNPVESGGVYDALSAKQDTLTFDSEPTIGSTNPVTSNGIAEALQNVQIDIATEQDAGIVKPDGTSVTVDNDGTIHAAAGVNFDETDFSKDEQSNIISLIPERRIFKGTKSEWDELSTAQKKEYGFAAFTGEDIQEQDIYSTSEIKTNKVWIDGKPIYRKVVVNIVPNTHVSVSDDIETVTNVFLSATSTNFTSSECYNWGSESGSVASDAWRITDGGVNHNKFYCRGVGSIFGSGRMTLMIEYTKTTD